MEPVKKCKTIYNDECQNVPKNIIEMVINLKPLKLIHNLVNVKVVDHKCVWPKQKFVNDPRC